MTGRPILHRDEYTAAVRSELVAWLEEAIFAPVLILLREAGVPFSPIFRAIRFDEFGRVNAALSAVATALRSGRIRYADGLFTGEFSAAISRQLRDAGATWNAKLSGYRLADSSLPLEIRDAVAVAAERSRALNQDVLKTLHEAEDNFAIAAAGIDVAGQFETIVASLGRQFVESVARIKPEGIGLSPTITPSLRAELRRELTGNLEISIKRFAQERIPELRARVEDNLFRFGGRTDRLAKIIEAEFGVAQRKAEFLADQETGLLVAKYRELRYRALGITEYVWSTSHDERVRPAHRRLDGKTFSFDDPPIVTLPGEPARRCNPGKDFRCRCVAIPKINLAELAA